MNYVVLVAVTMLVLHKSAPAFRPGRFKLPGAVQF
jgi:hypothetical protein